MAAAIPPISVPHLMNLPPHLGKFVRASSHDFLWDWVMG